MSVPATALAPPIDRDYTLEHKYTRTTGRIYLSGVQALVRLPLMQQMRDRAAGINTAGFISGYRGSPLGGFDLELWKAKKHLKASNIEFTPGLNEDLGATMVWGTQQANLFPGAKYDGVFAMWYGKGPGVDRCGDVFKHGNAAGTSQARRRARARGGRSCVSFVDIAARIGARVRLGDDAGAESGRRAGHPRHGPARLGDVALHRSLGRFQDDRGNGRIERERRRRSASARHRRADRFRVAAGRAQHPLARSAARSGNAPASVTPCRPRSRSRARTASIASSSIRRAHGSAS